MKGAPVRRGGLAAAIWLALAIVPRTGWAQLAPLPRLDPERGLARFAHQAWGRQAGLTHPEVHAIVQTRDGYLWVGTLGGVSRFDGASFTTFSSANTPALGSDFVQALAEDAEGTLWVGLRQGGLARHEGRRFTAVTADEGLPHRTIHALAPDTAGGLWVGSEAGLSVHRAGSWRHLGQGDGLPAGAVEAVAVAPDGVVWAGVREVGLARVAEGEATILPLPAHDRSPVMAIAPAADGSVWVGTEGGSLFLVRDSAVSEPRPAGLPDLGIADLLIDAHGALWIASTGGGLSRLHRGRLETLGPSEIDPGVLALAGDRDGALWVGTNGGGVHRLREGLFLPYTTAEGLADDDVSMVFTAPDGTVWAAGIAGVHRLEDGRFRRIALPGFDASDRGQALLVERDGTVWVGAARSGLHRWRAGTTRRWSEEEGLPSDDVRAVVRGGDGVLWIGTRRGPVRMDGGRPVPVPGLPGASVLAAVVDTGGTVWMGTEAGLGRLEGDRFVPVLEGRAVGALHADGAGVVWAGTVGHGLLRIEGDAVDALTEAEGLFDNYVAAIREDVGGHLWMCSNRGVFLVHRSQIERVRAGEAAKVDPRAYGTEEGMRSLECAGLGLPDVPVSADGELWIATRQGVLAADLPWVGTPDPPVVTVDAVLHNGQPVELSGDVRIRPGRRDMTFLFTAPVLVGPERLRFRYRLTGYDEAWSEGPQRSAAYANLPPGSYGFEAQAAQGIGAWGPLAAIPVVLEPRFTETAWFLVLVGMALGVALLQGHRWRLAAAERRQSELEAEVERRTDELAVANESLAEAKTQLEETVARRTERLRRVEREQSAILAASRDPLIAIDQHGVVQFASDAVERVFGWPPDELLGKSIDVLIPERYRDGEHRRLRLVASGETDELGPEDFTALHRDGHEFPCETNVSRLELPGQAEPLVLGLVRDVTERQRAREAILVSEARKSAVVEGARDCIVTMDVDGHVLGFNAAAEETLGYERSEVLGQRLVDVVVPPEHEEAYREAWAEHLGSGAPHDMEISVLRRDGESVPVRLTLTHGDLRTGKLVIAFLRDLTRERDLELQFRQAQKMEAVGRLAAGVAHDFNNLLTPILGYSELQISRDAWDDAARQSLEAIRAAGERGALLVSQLLGFSRPGHAEPSLFDVNSTVRGMERLLARAAADIELRVRTGREQATIEGDPGQIEQVLMNLVVNARDAMPEGGVIELHVEVLTLGEGHGDPRFDVPPGRYVLVEVSDTGHGMDEALASRIFEPFFTTKDVGKGTGLGLSTVAAIVETLQGKVGVRSEPSRGTTFTIVVPHAGEFAGSEREPGLGMRTSTGEHVLLVDDDAGVRDALSAVLEDAGYDVEVSASGGEAVEIAEARDRLDLLVTDLIMPGMSGTDVARRVRRAFPDVAVIYTTGYTARALTAGVGRSAGEVLLRKPIGRERLARALLDVLGPES